MRGVGALLWVLVSVVSAHDWDWGRCPSVPPMTNLSVDRFLGDWYVMEQFDTSSSCLMLNYTRLSETQLRVTKSRQLAGLSEVGLGHNTYGGTLDIPQASSGLFRVKWPLNVAGKSDYILFDTDYDTYAGVYDCQQMTSLFHRQSAAILSRTPSLAPRLVRELKRRLTEAAVPTRHFNTIQHEGCKARTDADLHTHLDGDTVPDLLDSARDGIEGAATSIYNGIRIFASTVGGSPGPSPTRPTTATGEPDVPTLVATGVPTTNVGVPLPGIGLTFPDAGVPTLTASVPTADGPPVFRAADEAPTDSLGPTFEEPFTPGVQNTFNSLPEAPTVPAAQTPVDATTRATTTIAPSTTTTTTTEAARANPLDDAFANIPFSSNNEIDSNDNNLDENFYNIDGANIEPVDGIVRTIVDISI